MMPRKYRGSVQHKPLGPVLGRAGSLEVRLVKTARERQAAQELRYKVFYEEMNATPDRKMKILQRDQDRFDPVCDHLIVVDKQSGTGNEGLVVGTYRLLRDCVANQTSGFYTQDEYDIDALIIRHPDKHFLELGRSCVLRSHRHKRTMELLWHGVWTYALHYKIDVMFGCASLPETNLVAISDQIAILQKLSRPPAEWRVCAHAACCIPSSKTTDLSEKRRFAKLPPLIKGYLRLGAYLGDGAVIDKDFGTTDVLVILPNHAINPRYVTYFGENADRHAA